MSGLHFWVLEMGCPDTLSQYELKGMSPTLIAALRLSCAYEPAVDFKQQAYSVIATKKVRGQRQPPNLCQLRTAFGLVVKQKMEPGQSELMLMFEEVNNYNRRRRVAGESIQC